MMRSMYSAISGLRTNQICMDVIGNNISNVNTPGYKKSRAVFKDTFYQTLQGASSPTGNRGGTNPQAIGLGVELGSVNMVTTPGSTRTTGKVTDLSVDGNGYFLVSDGNEQFYTRAGTFDFDEQGNFINSNGFKVMGYLYDENKKEINTQQLVPIDIASWKSVPPRATTEIKFSGNLSAGASEPLLTSKAIYDSQGYEHKVYFRFSKQADNTWQCEVFRNRDTDGDGVEDEESLIGATPWTITFDSGGHIIPFNAPVPAGEQPNYEMSFGFDPLTGADQMQIDSINLARLTQYDSAYTAWPELQDGYIAGEFNSFNIDKNGIIRATFSNGVAQDLGQVALATFQNPGGLEAAGGNLFKESRNSGNANVGPPSGGGRGSILPSSLEMSNVDLSEEFTEMIVTQRGFQASSRIITTSDEMLQELANLKR